MSLTVEPEIEEQIGEIVAGLVELYDDKGEDLPTRLNIKVVKQPDVSEHSFRAVLNLVDDRVYQLQKLRYLKR